MKTEQQKVDGFPDSKNKIGINEILMADIRRCWSVTTVTAIATTATTTMTTTTTKTTKAKTKVRVRRSVVFLKT